MEMENILLLLLGVMANNLEEQMKAEAVTVAKTQLRQQFQQDNLPKEARLLILDVAKQVAAELEDEYMREM